jgi:hypothetical protein
MAPTTFVCWSKGNSALTRRSSPYDAWRSCRTDRQCRSHSRRVSTRYVDASLSLAIASDPAERFRLFYLVREPVARQRWRVVREA